MGNGMIDTHQPEFLLTTRSVFIMHVSLVDSLIHSYKAWWCLLSYLLGQGKGGRQRLKTLLPCWQQLVAVVAAPHAEVVVLLLAAAVQAAVIAAPHAKVIVLLPAAVAVPHAGVVGDALPAVVAVLVAACCAAAVLLLCCCCAAAVQPTGVSTRKTACASPLCIVGRVCCYWELRCSSSSHGRVGPKRTPTAVS